MHVGTKTTNEERKGKRGRKKIKREWEEGKRLSECDKEVWAKENKKELTGVWLLVRQRVEMTRGWRCERGEERGGGRRRRKEKRGEGGRERNGASNGRRQRRSGTRREGGVG